MQTRNANGSYHRHHRNTELEDRPAGSAGPEKYNLHRLPLSTYSLYCLLGTWYCQVPFPIFYLQTHRRLDLLGRDHWYFLFANLAFSDPTNFVNLAMPCAEVYNTNKQTFLTLLLVTYPQSLS